MRSLSKINKNITIDFLREPENLYFDRKSANTDLKKIANEVASFANANGGVVAIGLNDNGEIEGFNCVGIDKLNEAQKIVGSYLKPAPICQIELVDVKNKKQEADKILLFHVEPSMNYVVRNVKDEVYCRQGDSSIKLTHDQIKNLEYDRKERNFETELIVDSSIDDIDHDVVKIFKSRIEANELDDVEVLKARGYLREINEKLVFTNSGMLLFGKNPSIYLPCSRLRVIKFEGNDFQTGTQMNVIKEKTFDKNIYRILNESKDFINSQLREFSYLNSDGVFEKHLEYPEFAWYEGIVNAVTHRDYSNSGEQILVKLYNNRMEILSPGKLGGFVTIDTIRVKRYSRNPQIARALVEFGIVRELNEGVKRIFKEMHDYNLNEPIYSEPDRNSVLLVLENNVEERLNVNKAVENENIKEAWNDLNYLEQKALEFITNNNGATRDELSNLMGRGKTSTINLLNKLIDKNLIVWTGTSKSDAYGKYIIK
ncbi:MAG: ATP-binding protein [Tissierellia bacterium]|nr:ATP-binding protein [Tissierellia bacterium]